jgi:uncharacterized membrane protein YjjP (DUF1212 family)
MAINIPIISEFDGTGVKKAVAQFKQLETVGEKAQFAIKKAAIPAAAAIGGLAIALGDATKAAMEDQAEQANLALILKNTTGASEDQVAAIEDQISAMSRASGIADTDYRTALEALTVGTKDTKKAMDDMNLVMDISTATGMDSTTVAEALAKAYEGNFKALKTLSPEIKAMVDEGKPLNEIMDTLAGTFGGAVSAQAETAAGKMAILKNSIGETKESIGAALLPVVEAVLPLLQKFADWAQKNPDAFTAIAGAIALVAAAVVATNIAMALNPFSLIAIGIGILVAGLVTAYKKFEWFRDGIKTIVNTITGFFEGMVNAAVTAVNLIIKAYNSIPILPNIPEAPKLSIPQLGASQAPRPAAGRLGIPRMAEGGIVSAPTLALIGEAGPEAVVPLSKMGQMSSPTNITVNVQGADPQQVVNALERYVRQNGALPGALL